jgi:rare lipoprotein A
MRYIIIFSLVLFSNLLTFSFDQEGVASWYGPAFHGRKTANGEIFNTNDYTAAHKTLPFGSIVKVVSLINGREVIVRINDRGPYSSGRIIDLSKAAATELDLISSGTMNVRIMLLEKGKNVYHRYKSEKYNIQIASFKNEDSALKLNDRLNGNNIGTRIMKVQLNEVYFRVVLENLNYSELQLYRVRLNENGISDYLVVRL